MQPLERLAELARGAAYEPGRGLRNTAEPEMAAAGVKELPVRLVPGCRTYAALSEDGVVVELGILEPGGDERALCTELSAALARWRATGGRLQLLT